MAVDAKISELPLATTPLSGTEESEIIQGGVNKRVAVSEYAGTPGGAVDSVNGQTGVVVLDATDVGADPAGTAATLVAAATVGLWDDRGTFSAAGGAYPSSGGSGAAGAILKGDIWTISVAGTLPTGQVVEIGDTVRALIDTPGNTQANWGILQNNIGFVPQPSDQDLTDIAALTPSNDDVLQRKAGAWTNRTLVQFMTDLGITVGIASVDTTGTAIAFAVPQIYNSSGTPGTGNITLVTTGLQKGMVQTLYHNDASEPTYPAEFVKIGGEDYEGSTLNIYYMHAISTARIEYTISHEI